MMSTNHTNSNKNNPFDPSEIAKSHKCESNGIRVAIYLLNHYFGTILLVGEMALSSLGGGVRGVCMCLS